MKSINTLVCIMLVFSNTSQQLTASQKDSSHKQRMRPGGHAVLGLPNRTKSNINNVSSWYDDDGTQELNTRSGNSGLTYPRQTATAVFAAGLLWGGIFNDGTLPQLRVNGQSYNTGTQRGAILGIRTGITEDPAAPDVRIWRVRRDYFTADLTLDAAEIFEVSPDQVTAEQIQSVRDQYATNWVEWPAYKGAPFYDSDGDGIYTPEFDNGVPVPYPTADEPGLADADQVVWYVCNDLTNQPWTNVQSGIEEQATVWGYNQTDALGSAIFKRFRLIYKGTASTLESASIENMYIGQWSDPDVGSFSDDFAGCDSARGLGYAYNGQPVDAEYSTFGLEPPASGYDLLQGPVIVTGNSLDTAIFDFRKIAGATNVPTSSFVYYEAGGLYSDPPFDANGGVQWYQVLRGLPPTPQGPPDPPPFINPNTGQPTFFWLSGDPVTQTGWIDGTFDGPGDRRFLIATGPFFMALGDTQEIVVSTILGLGSSYLNSITVLRSNDDSVQNWFNELVDWSFPVDVREFESDFPQSFELSQNYPNPFNPRTEIGFQITDYGLVSLKAYDLLGREVATLVNEELPPGTYTRQWDASGVSSGVYFYRLKAGKYVATRKLVLLR